MNNRINDSISAEGMIAVVESFLINELKRKSFETNSVDIGTSRLFCGSMVPDVDQLVKSSCFSTRSFERHFAERMGVSPKYFLKVMRFESAFRMKNKNPREDWLSVALACGYYDYQHLSKVYRELTGLTPNQFHALDRVVYNLSSQHKFK